MGTNIPVGLVLIVGVIEKIFVMWICNGTPDTEIDKTDFCVSTRDTKAI